METLQQYCITSAKHYLEYLEKYNLGLEEIKILDAKLLHNKTLLLVLEKPLLSTDYLQLCIGTFILDIDSVADKSFNNVTHVLQLQLSHDIMAISPNNIELSYCTDNPSSLESHDKQEITYQDMPFLEILDNDSKWQYNLRLFVDLKFLVKNIYDFCKHDSFRFAFPTKKPIQFTLPFDSHVSEEQQNAIKGIFSHSISYIWGISGSGKTQIVLFHALLNLIKQNKKAHTLALKSALSLKTKKDLVVLDEFKVSGKTKEVVKLLSAFKAENVKTLIVSEDPLLLQGANNVSNVTLRCVGNISVYDLLNNEKVIVSKEDIKRIEASLNGNK